MSENRFFSAVTGSRGALGRRVVETLCARGDRVFGIDREISEDLEGIDGFTDHPADLTDASDVARVFEDITREADRLDAVVATVGGYSGGSALSETTDSEWVKMLDLNLTTAFNTARAALPYLRKSPHGRLILISSRVAESPGKNQAAYNVSKAGVLALARSIAVDEKSVSTVTANAVLPSVIDTPANRASMPDADHERWVSPTAIAGVIAFLTSPDSQPLNGAAIPVYGDA